MGSWCGYTVIPKTFPIDFEKEIDLDCHGGITYQSINSDGDLFIGLDCSHFGDLVPKYLESHSQLSENSIYRDGQFIIDEVNSMVEQIINLLPVKRHLKINTILKNN